MHFCSTDFILEMRKSSVEIYGDGESLLQGWNTWSRLFPFCMIARTIAIDDGVPHAISLRIVYD